MGAMKKEDYKKAKEISFGVDCLTNVIALLGNTTRSSTAFRELYEVMLFKRVGDILTDDQKYVFELTLHDCMLVLQDICQQRLDELTEDFEDL